MTDFTGLYDIRDAKAEDRNFVLATFLRGIYYGDSWFSQIEKRTFMDNYKLVAQALVDKAVVKVACDKDDTNVILGYSILSPDFQIVHWVYVKDKFRRGGIAKALTPKHPKSVSHLTLLGSNLLPKLNGAVFNPFAI